MGIHWAQKSAESRLLDWGLRFVETMCLASHLGWTGGAQATTVAGSVAAAAPATLAYMGRERALTSPRAIVLTALPKLTRLWRGAPQLPTPERDSHQ